MAQFTKLTAGALGNDPTQMTSFAAFLQGEATQMINEVFSKIDSKITGTTWSGSDATQFEGSWEQVANTTKTNISNLFEDTATTLKTNAQNQESTSNAL